MITHLSKTLVSLSHCSTAHTFREAIAVTKHLYSVYGRDLKVQFLMQEHSQNPLQRRRNIVPVNSLLVYTKYNVIPWSQRVK